jgi:dihydropteroate synthase
MLHLRHLAELAAAHRDALDCPTRAYEIGGVRLDGDRQPALMGVVNLSPDSWYRESVCLTTETAVRRGRVLQAQGAQLVDLGAESTLADAARAAEDAQKSRLLPVVRELVAADVVVSVETYQPAVARACLEAGARVLNCTGVAEAPELFRAAAAHDAAVIICYVHGDNVREVGDLELGADPVAKVEEFFQRQVDLATQAGVEKIFLDPGLGFYYPNLQDGRTRVRHQMAVFLNTFRLRRLGFPICHALPHAFEFFGEEVRCAEPFFAVLAALGGTGLFRTHEVARVKAVLDTLACWE